MTSNQLQKGEEAKCDKCGYTAMIDTEPLELFKFTVTYGEGDHTEQFLERDGEVTCYECNGGKQ